MRGIHPMSDASDSDAQSAESSGSPGSKPKAPEPEVPPDYDKALELLRMQGASAEAADRALKATAEHQPSNATRSETRLVGCSDSNGK